MSLIPYTWWGVNENTGPMSIHGAEWFPNRSEENRTAWILAFDKYILCNKMTVWHSPPGYIGEITQAKALPQQFTPTALKRLMWKVFLLHKQSRTSRKNSHNNSKCKYCCRETITCFRRWRISLSWVSTLKADFTARQWIQCSLHQADGLSLLEEPK